MEPACDEHDSIHINGSNYRTVVADLRQTVRHRNSGVMVYGKEGVRYGRITHILHSFLRAPTEGWSRQVLLKVALFDVGSVKELPLEGLTLIPLGERAPKQDALVLPGSVCSVGFVVDPEYAPEIAIVHCKLPWQMVKETCSAAQHVLSRAAGAQLRTTDVYADMNLQRKVTLCVKRRDMTTRGRSQGNRTAPIDPQATTARMAAEPQATTAPNRSRGKRTVGTL
eukprot:7113116-Prorocentrum_lima.AAC.1